MMRTSRRRSWGCSSCGRRFGSDSPPHNVGVLELCDGCFTSLDEERIAAFKYEHRLAEMRNEVLDGYLGGKRDGG